MRSSDSVHAFLASLGLHAADLVAAEQIHGTAVQWVDDTARATQIPGTDALVYTLTESSPGLILGVRTADCVPVLVYDSDQQVISAIHSGWKGTVGGIVTKTIQSMIEHGSKASHISCVIGPHIRSCCYSVPKARADLFTDRYGKTSVIYQNFDHFLDLAFVIRSQILAFNIDHAHIIDQGMCTSCNEQQYYSFRKDTKDTFGEMLGFIAISR